MWTDDHKHRTYTTVTGHWIEDWKLHNRVLTTEEFDSTLAKTGINVKEQLVDIFQALGLETDHLQNAIFTTDKGSNIVLALKEEERLDCINHVLNRVVQPSLEDKNAHKQIMDLLRSVKKLVRYVKKNSLQDHFKKTLKQCNSTRWNSIYEMLKSVLEAYEDLQAVFALHKTSEMWRVLNINYNLLKQLTDFLKPFFMATKVFEEEKKPTLHLVIPRMISLQNHCEITKLDPPALKELKKKASAFIKEKFNPHILHKVAVFLNPWQKSMRALSSEDQELVLDYVDEEIKSFPSKTEQVEEGPTPPAKKARYDDTFDDIVEEDQISEVQAYQMQKVAPSEDKDVLGFWQGNKSNFPALAAMARKVFAVMSTSSASERNFSLAGHVVSARRSSLKSSSVNNILFLNSAIRAKRTRE